MLLVMSLYSVAVGAVLSYELHHTCVHRDVGVAEVAARSVLAIGLAIAWPIWLILSLRMD